MSKAKQLIESAAAGTLPGDLLRDMIYGERKELCHRSKPADPLVEDTGGGVEIPDATVSPEDDQVAQLGPGEMALFTETAEQKAQYNELLNALSAAAVIFDVEYIEETGETIISWAPGQGNTVINAMQALGIDHSIESESVPVPEIEVEEIDDTSDVESLISKAIHETDIPKLLDFIISEPNGVKEAKQDFFDMVKDMVRGIKPKVHVQNFAAKKVGLYGSMKSLMRAIQILSDDYGFSTSEISPSKFDKRFGTHQVTVEE